MKSPLASVPIGTEQVAEVFDGLPLSHRREIVRTLMTVTLLPPGRGSRHFDPASVRIDWKQ